MAILKIKKDIHNQAELQRRKAELRARMDREFAEIQETMKLVREDFRPANVLKSAVNSLWKPKGGDSETGLITEAVGERIAGLRGPVRLLTSLLVRDPRIALILKAVGPVILGMAPKLVERAGEKIPRRKSVYGALRRRVAALRAKMHAQNTEPQADTPPESPEAKPILPNA